MGFYNISNILYNLRKIFKYLLSSLFVVAFIIVCLLLMGTNVKAVTYTSGFTDTQITNDIIPTYENIVENNPQIITDYPNWICTLNPGGTAMMSFFTSSNDNKCYYNSNIGYVNSTNSVVGHSYSLYGSGNYGDAGSFNAASLGNRIGFQNGSLCFYGNQILYNSNLTDIIWAPDDYNPVTPPYIALPNDSTSNYISGEFSHFLVVSNTDINELYFFLDEVNTDFTGINSIVLPLNSDSPYFLNNLEFVDGGRVFAIPKNILSNGYLNDYNYNMYLAYAVGDEPLQTTTLISWTTDFSAKAIENDKIREEALLNHELNNINGFLNNKNYNSSNIVNNMPNSSNYISPTDDGINSIFTSLYNAFTRDTAEPVRFYLPFVNDAYIDIPADIVSSHLPSTIIFLIQTFYWYLICRYIIKDIAGIAQKAKSGEILDASTDNIKTELL